MTAKEKVTLTLPSSLVDAIREMAPPRGQSKFVAEAVEYFIERKRRQVLREELIEGYKATAEESLAFTKELEAADNEDWLKHVPPYEGEEPPHDEQNS